MPLTKGINDKTQVKRNLIALTPKKHLFLLFAFSKIILAHFHSLYL